MDNCKVCGELVGSGVLVCGNCYRTYANVRLEVSKENG